MNLQQRERELETLEQEAVAIAAFVSTLDNCRLHVLSIAIDAELALRREGKPADPAQLH